MNKPLGDHKQTVRNIWPICPIVMSIFSSIIIVLNHTDDIYQNPTKKSVLWISIKDQCYILWTNQNSRNCGRNIPMSPFYKYNTI